MCSWHTKFWEKLKNEQENEIFELQKQVEFLKLQNTMLKDIEFGINSKKDIRIQCIFTLFDDKENDVKNSTKCASKPIGTQVLENLANGQENGVKNSTKRVSKPKKKVSCDLYNKHFVYTQYLKKHVAAVHNSVE